MTESPRRVKALRRRWDRSSCNQTRAVTSRRVLGYGYSLIKEPVPKSGTEYLLVSFNYNDRGMQTDRIMFF